MNAHTSIVLAGSSGFIGTELEKRLLREGYSVTRLTRHIDPSASSESPVKQVAWDPSHGYIDQSTIDSADAVINLAGANISGKRWDRISKKEILKSRIDATRTLVNAINRPSFCQHLPPVTTVTPRGRLTSPHRQGPHSLLTYAWIGSKVQLAPSDPALGLHS